MNTVNILSIYKDHNCFKVALLNKKGKKLRIELLRTFQRQEKDSSVKLLHILQPILSHTSFYVTTALLNRDTLIRKISLNVNSWQKAQEALPFQIESHLPLNSEDTEVFVIPQKSSKQQKNALIVGIKAGTLQEHLEALFQEEITPDVVSCLATSYMRFLRSFFAFSSPIVGFHFEKTELLCVLSIEGELISTKVFPLGSQDLIEALKTDLMITEPQKLDKISSELILSEVKQDTLPEVYKFVSKLKGYLERLTSYYKQTFNIDHFDYVCTGDVYHPCKLASVFEEMFHKVGMECSNIAHPYSNETLQEYAAPISLGLDYLENDEKTLQILKETSFGSRLGKTVLKKFIATTLVAFSIPLTIFLGTYFYKTQAISKLEKQLCSKIDPEDRKLLSTLSLEEKIRAIQEKNKKARFLHTQFKKNIYVQHFLITLMKYSPSQVHLNTLHYTTDSPKEKFITPQQGKFSLSLEAPTEELARYYYSQLLQHWPTKIDEGASFLEKKEEHFSIILVFDLQGA